MASGSVEPRWTVRPWLAAATSGWIFFHLLAVLVNVLAAPTGPWTGEPPFGPPPRFAEALLLPDSVAQPRTAIVSYLAALKLLHNYHFVENLRAQRARFEARLRDADGQELVVVQFPDPAARPAIRHRQTLLAEGLAEDRQVEPPSGEFIPAPNQPVPTVRYWQIDEQRIGSLATIEQHLLPRDRELFAPTPWAMLLARSYARHLCRVYGAASAEINRQTRDPVPVEALESPTPIPADPRDILTVSFGVLDGSNQPTR